ncbi:UNVERIFIED_CONTAM: hypothetical protein GTU68_059727 [Idotea baltica]|nr:hypothetical protein [Idotea baltica]
MVRLRSSTKFATAKFILYSLKPNWRKVSHRSSFCWSTKRFRSS